MPKKEWFKPTRNDQIPRINSLWIPTLRLPQLHQTVIPIRPHRRALHIKKRQGNHSTDENTRRNPPQQPPPPSIRPRKALDQERHADFPNRNADHAHGAGDGVELERGGELDRREVVEVAGVAGVGVD